MGMVLGIDIGGTSIKAGLFTESGTLVSTKKIPTGKLVNEDAFAVVIGGLEELLSTNGASPLDVVAAGLDVPGPVDDNGQVAMMPNAELDAEGLKAAMAGAFPNMTLAFANDVNAAAVGEMWKGAAKGVPSFALVALGTGVGAGVVVSGKLVSGAFGAGGEFGHITVNRGETSACGCGRHGCLEQYASASGVVRSYRRECSERGIEAVHLQGPTDTLSVFEAYRSGDEAAKAAISLMCDSLGFALAQVSTIIDPSLYLIGGGMGEGFDLFAQELRAAFKAHCLPTCADARILPAALGNEAAMYGDAYLAMKSAGAFES
ncbi:MAG: ROK family protein [Eggerthellaceae bacterium]|nr:ROK family protein [Eggerthellaceae bacterium]